MYTILFLQICDNKKFIMSWSKKRHNRQSWAEEVIAAAMKIEITNQEVKNPDELDDEGIVSDESTPSSSNDESITPDNNEKTTQESRKQAPIMIKEKTRKEKVHMKYSCCFANLKLKTEKPSGD